LVCPKASFALGITSAGIGFGGVVMPLLAQWLISAYSWQDAFKVMAGIMILVGTPVSIVIMRTRPEDKGLLPDGKSSLEKTDQGGMSQLVKLLPLISA
jgi:sugar phosphate permease